MICALAEVGQRSTNNACNDNHTTLNATANECTPTQCAKRRENTEGETKKNEVEKTAKHVPITCFYKKNNNVSNNRCNVFTIDMEIDSEYEADTVKRITKVICNKMGKETKQEQEKGNL